ncbi:hypothetical protein GNF76_19355 [Pseudomonas sp. CCM 7893]|uniref:DUF3742 family protein n=1 Tax=Pseudomonas spelaei TaxID=1055469 RepID=A0A6I3W8F6_9PSED|nr:hypothetical protein [Pseudomonas spelaei]MUF06515.1 hypothetical protein [Pseudomonas spelaei]
MTAQTSQRIASRLGYGLGKIVRLVWFSQNRTLRLAKRLVLALVLLYFSADILSGIVSVAVFALAFGGGLWVLSSRISEPPSKRVEYGRGYGSQGYGYYKAGRRVDD